MTTLGTTKIAFDNWRAERINASVPFPANLWDRVKQLLETHKKTEICKTLGLSGSQIKKHCKENPTLKKATESDTASMSNLRPQQIPVCDDFVTATSAPQSLDVPAKESMSMLTLTGSNKTLRLSIPTSALPDVLPALGALL